MIKKISMLTLAFLLIFASVYAEDSNSINTIESITPDELAAALAQMRLETQAATSQIVTVRMDSETQQLFAKLEDKMVAMEQKLTIIEDRFMLLKNDLSDKIDTSATKTTAEVSAKNSQQITEMNTDHKKFVRDMTNPIRINLPNFGLWLTLTAIFMLTAGLKRKKAVKNADRELVKINDEKVKEAVKNGRS